MKKVHFLRATYFVWIIVPVAAVAIYHVQGAPHVLLSYDWLASGSDSFSLANRTYTRCTWWGPSGWIIDDPHDGKCRWLKFALVERSR